MFYISTDMKEVFINCTFNLLKVCGEFLAFGLV